MAANSTDNTNTEKPAVSKEMHMQGGGGRQGGGRGGMEVPPGDAMQNGETPPAMPVGEMPGGEMTPPDNSGNAENGNTQQTQPSDSENTADGATDATNENTSRMQKGGMGGMNGGMQDNGKNAPETTEAQSQNGILNFVKTYSTPILSVIFLILTFVFVSFYKRKSY